MRLEELDGGKFALFFDGDENDMSAAYDIQERFENTIEDIVYVPMDGIEDDKLIKDRFLLTNPQASLINHFLWENLFTEEEQQERVNKMINDFFETGKRFTIEEYDFVEEEPFFDYGDAN
jgi:hypothetical protein